MWGGWGTASLFCLLSFSFVNEYRKVSTHFTYMYQVGSVCLSAVAAADPSPKLLIDIPTFLCICNITEAGEATSLLGHARDDSLSNVGGKISQVSVNI